VIAVDAGILALAANRHARDHAPATQALERLINGGPEWGLPWPAAHEFVRRVTHPHACVRPLGAGDAVGFLQALLAAPGARPLAPGPRHAESLLELIAAGASPIRDPQRLELAAVLREHGVRELLTTDAGMRRWRFLSVVDPVENPQWRPGGRPQRRYRALRVR
jgi:predicted nucleic acid-binding protein